MANGATRMRDSPSLAMVAGVGVEVGNTGVAVGGGRGDGGRERRNGRWRGRRGVRADEIKVVRNDGKAD